MSVSPQQRRRVRNSAIALALFAGLLYTAFIVYSIKGH
jgi:hypothetical protein